jgi:hypothetical protein
MMMRKMMKKTTMSKLCSKSLIAIKPWIIKKAAWIMQACHSTIECLKIVGRFRGIFEALDGEIRVTNFNYINSSFCNSNFMITI